MSVLLFGAAGQLGRALLADMAGQHQILPLTRTDIDLTDQDALARVIDEVRPAIILNVAAYTQVDRAESERDICDAVNHQAVRVMADAALRHDALLVTYSTDYVFDGRKDSAYSEDDTPTPLNTYGRTKLNGEEAVLASGARALILRTSWLHSHGQGFPARLLSAAKDRTEMVIPADQMGQPTSAASLSQATIDLLEKYDGSHHGIFHCAAPQVLSRAQWAQNVFEAAGRAVKVLPGVTADIAAAAARPLNSCLSCAKMLQDYGVSIPLLKRDIF
jgi:dTDP-4-dehydrorhamnose reductase